MIWLIFIGMNVIVIGATSGIGRALSIKYLSANNTVGITGRRRELLDEIVAQFPNSTRKSIFDISILENEQHLNKLAHKIGGLDLLIICSGIGELNQDLNFKIEHDTINVNVAGFSQVADWAVNYFIRQGNGYLTAITSIAGIRGGRQAPAYNASKAYQINYLEGLRQKVKHLNLPITITDIRPGFVDTAMAKGNGKFWVASAEKAASQIYMALNAKKKVVYITKRWQLIAWILKIIPRRLWAKM